MLDMNRLAFLSQAESLLSKSTFTKEDAAKVSGLIDLANSLTDKTELRRATENRHARELVRME